MFTITVNIYKYNQFKWQEQVLLNVSDKIGNVADVNLHETEQGDYIEIVVEPQPNQEPIWLYMAFPFASVLST